MSASVSQSGVVTRLPIRHPSSGSWSRFQGFLGRSRSWIHAHPRLRTPYRALVAVVGVTIVIVGLILVPLPGPGWLIVFVGVAVLGTEFPAAHRLSQGVRRQARRLQHWWQAHRKRQAARSAGTGHAA